MPKRSRKQESKERKQHRSYKRPRKNWLQRTGTVSLGKSPIPTRIMATLPYCETVSIVPSAGAIGTYVFSLNSLNDPNNSGTGHQPYTYDQRMLMHDHYTVIGAKITATFVSTGTSPFICGIRVADTNTTISDYRLAQELPRSNYKVVPGAVAAGENIRTVVATFSAKKFFGIKDFIGKDLYRGTVSTNPNEMAFAHVFAGTHDGSSSSGTVKAVVRIEYMAMFTEPKQSIGLS